MSTTKQGPALDEATLKKAVAPERYAEVLAHILHFRSADPTEIARRLGLAPDLWQAADTFWTEELALGIRRQQRELALRFSTALSHTRSRLTRTQPTLASIGTLEPAASPAPTAPAIADGAQTPAHALPSFMAAPAPQLPSFTAAAATPAPAPAVVPANVAPALVTASPASAGAPQAPAAAPPSPAAATTAAAATPSTAPVAAPPSSFKRPATIAMPTVAVLPDEAPPLPLPFSEGVASAVALERAIEHADAIQGSKPARPPPLGSTSPAEADLIAAIARRVMPFAETESPAAPAPTSGPPAPAPAAPTPAAPAPAPAAETAPALPLERHASLHVELTLHPEKRAEILRRYGLSTAQYAGADAQWQARLAKDTSLRAAWDTACEQYRVWLLRTSAAG